ncbi:WecB/TagA/CpsF family glycosyltransferase [Candidatus Pacearchaeota archaeon]|nr:WecB/TagA/CpsF family glycosyltransferase [Candidatus Pacearchaeota archaeon]
MAKKIKFSRYNYKDIRGIIKSKPKKLIFSFMNANDIYCFSKDKDFQKSVTDPKMNRITSVDGTTTAIVLSIKNFQRVKRLTGPELTDKIFKDQDVIDSKKHFFIGVDESDLVKIREKYPLLKQKKMSGYNPPYVKGTHFSAQEVQKMVKIINKFKPDFLWIGIGCPKQEILAYDLYDKINPSCIFNVGAALQYIQGTQKRAPKFFRSLGLEWLYRLFKEFKLTSKKLWNSMIGTIIGFFLIKLDQ